MHNNQHQQFNEGLEYGDLKRLVHTELHADEFKSKMGDDSDIVVLSFKVTEKEPALDLVNFVEKGYDWVLDADVSSGELSDGQYLVFVEMERNDKVSSQIDELLSDLLNLTEQDISEWRFQYQKGKQVPYTIDALAVIPTSAEEYNSKYKQDEDLAAMQESARVPMNRRAPVNDFTESLRIAAGLK